MGFFSYEVKSHLDYSANLLWPAFDGGFQPFSSFLQQHSAPLRFYAYCDKSERAFGE